MKRRPNPWIAIPSLLAGGISGALGWIVTSVSCTADIAPGVPGEPCPGWATTFAILGLVGGTIGMAVVVVLAFRSLAEFHDSRSRGVDPPGPGCEAPQDDA
jgi:hypothetical protein